MKTEWPQDQWTKVPNLILAEIQAKFATAVNGCSAVSGPKWPSRILSFFTKKIRFQPATFQNLKVAKCAVGKKNKKQLDTSVQ